MLLAGKMLVVLGIIAVVVGLLLMAGAHIPWFGRLPGDIHLERKSFSFHFPIVTSIIVSIILTILINLFMRNR